MPTKLILRFSNFGYDTIQEHKKYIDDPKRGGSVWWGWWKKEGVDPDVRDELSQLSLPVETGLFNRNQNKFYRSLVKAVQIPKKSNRMTSPNKNQTPGYYRYEPCAAWFLIAEIFEVSRDQFEYQFGSIPFGERTLHLRTMVDTTAQKDKEGPSLPAPFKTDSDTILHLSDLHFGGDYGYPQISAGTDWSLCDRLIQDLEGVRVGVVLVSGDVITQARHRDYKKVTAFLQKLATCLGLDVVRQLVVVPGNHDIRLTSKPDKRQVIRNAVNWKQEKPFRNFLKQLHGVECEVPRVERICLKGQLIEILAMNSVRLRYKPWKDYGFVDWSLYRDMLGPSTALEGGPLRIAVLHHHLLSAFPIEMPIEDRPISITVDAGEVLVGLQRLGFRVVLQGHQHVPRVSRVSRGLRNDNGSLDALDHPIYIISGGSSGSKRLYDPMPLNTYSLLTLGSNHIHLRIRQYNKGRNPETYIEDHLPL